MHGDIVWALAYNGRWKAEEVARFVESSTTGAGVEGEAVASGAEGAGVGVPATDVVSTLAIVDGQSEQFPSPDAKQVPDDGGGGKMKFGRSEPFCRVVHVAKRVDKHNIIGTIVGSERFQPRDARLPAFTLEEGTPPTSTVTEKNTGMAASVVSIAPSTNSASAPAQESAIAQNLPAASSGAGTAAPAAAEGSSSPAEQEPFESSVQRAKDGHPVQHLAVVCLQSWTVCQNEPVAKVVGVLGPVGTPTALTSSKMYHEYQFLTEMAVFARNPICFRGRVGWGVRR